MSIVDVPVWVIVAELESRGYRVRFGKVTVTGPDGEVVTPRRAA